MRQQTKVHQYLVDRYLDLIFLCLCVFLPGLMTITQVYEYEKEEGGKSVPQNWYYGAQKNTDRGINTVKFCGGHMMAKTEFFIQKFTVFSEFYIFHRNLSGMSG